MVALHESFRDGLTKLQFIELLAPNPSTPNSSDGNWDRCKVLNSRTSLLCATVTFHVEVETNQEICYSVMSTDTPLPPGMSESVDRLKCFWHPSAKVSALNNGDHQQILKTIRAMQYPSGSYTSILQVVREGGRVPSKVECSAAEEPSRVKEETVDRNDYATVLDELIQAAESGLSDIY